MVSRRGLRGLIAGLEALGFFSLFFPRRELLFLKFFFLAPSFLLEAIPSPDIEPLSSCAGEDIDVTVSVTKTTGSGSFSR